MLSLILSVLCVTTNKSFVEEVPRQGVVIKSKRPDKEYIEACNKSRKCRLLREAGYYEARNQSDKGVAAVMHVILNRVNHKAWASSVEGVLSAPHQFSYRFDGSMKKGFAEKEQRDRIAVIAMKVVEGEIPSPVGLAVFYHSTQVFPSWRNRVQYVGRIGSHLFYK